MSVIIHHNAISVEIKCQEPLSAYLTINEYYQLKGVHMKIAAITDDGKTISQHFGRAPYYLVVTVEDGQIVERELRDKLGHAHFVNQPHEPEQPGQPHGMSSTSHNKHLQMAEAIGDCEALLCGGMGMGAYQSMVARGIKPVVTEIWDIDQAVMAYVEGKIVDRIDKLH
jgi:predicted Fe-Mo cluster-binding NifX family protein